MSEREERYILRGQCICLRSAPFPPLLRDKNCSPGFLARIVKVLNDSEPTAPDPQPAPKRPEVPDFETIMAEPFEEQPAPAGNLTGRMPTAQELGSEPMEKADEGLRERCEEQLRVMDYSIIQEGRAASLYQFVLRELEQKDAKITRLQRELDEKELACYTMGVRLQKVKEALTWEK